MSVIAWDGKTLCADKRASIGGTSVTVTKIKKINGSLFGCVGDYDIGLSLFNWVANGMQESQWPSHQKDNDRWGTIIQITKDKKIFRYEREPHPYQIEEPFIAVGSGIDLALGALAMGATARKAVEIASKYNIHCGNGIDSLRLK